jgi:hypothetical protein
MNWLRYLKMAVVLIGAVLILSFALLSHSTAAGSSSSDFANANAAIQNAYSAVYDAQKNHANVSSLIDRLNGAVELVSLAHAINSTNPHVASQDLVNATMIAQQVTSGAGSASQSGMTSFRNATYGSLAFALAIGIVASVLCIFSSRIDRQFWLITHRHYAATLMKNEKIDDRLVVRRKKNSFSSGAAARKNAAIAIVLLFAGLIILGLLQPIYLSSVGRSSGNAYYSEIGLLGPAQTIGDYPTNVVENHSFLLYGYVGNHQGSPQYYEIFVKLGDQKTQISNLTSANATIVDEYYRVLDNNQSYAFPMNLSLPHRGNNYRLIFELWRYDVTVSNFTYTGLWSQIWVNVLP